MLSGSQLEQFVRGRSLSEWEKISGHKDDFVNRSTASPKYIPGFSGLLSSLVREENGEEDHSGRGFNPL